MYLDERVADPWMNEYVLSRGAPELTGYHSDEDQKGLSWSLRDQLPATNIKPASLWRRPVSNAVGDKSSTVKDHPTARLALVHQEKGGLFCEYSGRPTKASNEKYDYIFFFAENGRRNSREYSVAVRLATKSLESQTAVIDLDRMRRKGAPERAGAAILLSVVDELDGIADGLLIRNPPKAFVDILHKEQWVQETKDGYRMERQALKQFLERRLGWVR